MVPAQRRELGDYPLIECRSTPAHRFDDATEIAAVEQDDGGGDEDQDEAARAFDDLRAEINVQRRAIEALFDQLESARPPDYAHTLGVISERIGEVEERLASYEEHPALKLTPEQHGRAVASAGADLLRNAVQAFDREARETERERHQLARMIGTVRDRHQQRRALVRAAVQKPATVAAGIVPLRGGGTRAVQNRTLSSNGS